MTLKFRILAPAAGVLLLLPSLRSAPLADYLARAPFPMPRIAEPSFPARNFPIADYGAVGDGHTLNTRAIARAIAACAQAGGGHVVVPAGLWLTGPIVLQAGVDLHTEAGALVQFTADHSVYAMVVRPGRDTYTAQSEISAGQANNIALTGPGVFDGAGDTWRPARHNKATDLQWAAMLAKGDTVSGNGADWWPSRQALAGEDYLAGLAQKPGPRTAADYVPARDFLRSAMISLHDCDNVLIAGPTFRNSPSGILSPNHCNNLIIRDASFLNEWWAQNGDGLDLANCHGTAVYRCTFSTGDDAICMKAEGQSPYPGEAGLRYVIVAECTVYHGHGGFVVGGTTESGMADLWCTQCVFDGTDVGIRVKSGLGHGGLVHAVTVDHIYMHDIANGAIDFNTFYDNTPVTNAKVKVELGRDPAKTPEFRDIRISDVYCLGAGAAISLTGLHQRPLHDITIRHCEITAQKGFSAVDAADITLQAVKIHAAKGPPVKEKDTSNIRFLD
ncbi:MAG TPA: glycosyl hydrolase family 28 protein [Opitutaceae bacterium]|nr:glycosyl hydrolase family 28 protein [Opitutaceae bacterium]